MAARLMRMVALLAVVAGIFGAVVLLGEWLRPPGVPTSQEPLSDPRIEVDCPSSAPTTVPLVTSSALYDCPDVWDGVRVRYRGEVVGAVLQRGDEAWVQLNDDVYAGDLGPLPAHRDFRGGNAGIGVRVDDATAEAITLVGGPRTSGDIVDIVGVFHRVDEASAEIAVIRADDARIVEPGARFEQLPSFQRMVAVAVLVALLGAVWLLDRRRLSRD